MIDASINSATDLSELSKHIQMRAEMGREKYGTYLKTDNGRNPLVDAYQEALDQIGYLRQAIAEITTIADLDPCYPILPEPAPVDNGGQVVWELVMSDLLDPTILERPRVGLRETYRLAILVAEQIRLQIEDRHWVSKVIHERRDRIKWRIFS